MPVPLPFTAPSAAAGNNFGKYAGQDGGRDGHMHGAPSPCPDQRLHRPSPTALAPCRLPCYHRAMTFSQTIARLAVLAASASLLACSSAPNWRDYRSPDAPYRVMFPDKPAVHKRTIDLDGMQVEMTMTAVDRDGTVFAVGSAEAPDAARASAAVAAMRTALVRNIGATVTAEKASAQADASGTRTALDVQASGTRNGTPMKLIGHFEARGKQFYQVIVMGKASAMPAQEVDQFMTSFTLL